MEKTYIKKVETFSKNRKGCAKWNFDTAPFCHITGWGETCLESGFVVRWQVLMTVIRNCFSIDLYRRFIILEMIIVY